MEALIYDDAETARDELEDRIDRAITRRVTQGGLWSEDGISEDLVAGIAALRSIAYETPDGYAVCAKVLPFKARGAVEEAHGDICFLVEASYETEGPFQGVCFFEAKIRRADGGFHFRQGQPGKYLQNTAHSWVLYYDYERFPPLGSAFCAEPLESLAVLAPSGAVASMDTRECPTAIATPLSTHLAFRTLLGYDLDQRSACVRSAFSVGARYYLDVRLGVGRSIDIAQELADEIGLRNYPSHVVDMWRTNEYLRGIAERDRSNGRDDNDRGDRGGGGRGL